MDIRPGEKIALSIDGVNLNSTARTLGFDMDFHKILELFSEPGRVGCGREHPLYNSCRNRHCPACQGLAANRWSEARAADILPVPYCHVVFTLPAEIAAIAFCNRGVVFDILFRVVAETRRTIAADRRHGGIRIGGTAVLHTLDQKLLFHPHLHVVVPNAGFDLDSGEWKTGSGTFLAPVKVLASLFRRRFLEELARMHGKGEIAFHGDIAHLANAGEFQAALAAARGRDWVVYAKQPFHGPEQVFRYLSRYTHRIAISDSRIVACDGEKVSFRHRNLGRPGERKPRYGTATVAVDEFIRRFLLHVLPDGMHRIRHCGILSNGCRARTLGRAREALGSRRVRG
ncbi:MAG: transposase [Defluviicoccus sp.]|nr:transposase [Defluviicoccus sp.]